METTTAPDRAEMRARMHAMWNGVAPAWERHAEYVDTRAEPITAYLLDGVNLRPGGRLGVATWASKDENPWLGILMGAFAEETGRTVPQPGMPGPFALDHAERLLSIFRDAGLTGTVETHPAPMRVASFDEWWER